jgi:3-phosphoshikimate 1-carboxyvinyltransferase
LICAAFADKATFLSCPQTNEDIEATANCLNAIGAQIIYQDAGYLVTPVSTIPAKVSLDCGESGSTLRFLLPIVCALGIPSTFHLHGRLPYRPLSPLWEELECMGCTLTRPTETTIATSGKLKAGIFRIRGDVSSQYITGLLFAAALMEGESNITILGNLESKPYIDMTRYALKDFGVNTDDFKVKGSFPFISPGLLRVEGDWSNAAFFLGAQSLGNPVNVTNLNPNSPQGDRAVFNLLQSTQQMPTISAADIPDLVPILAVVYGAKCGAKFTNIARLRLKESDRVASVCNMLNAFGATAMSTENTLTVYPGQYHSCTIDAMGDHRIAMAAAIGASVADGPVTILGAQCVAKSYPTFWEIYKNLGGHYEQYIR